MTKNKNVAPKLTSREKIINANINRVRDELIATQLEAEFYEKFASSHADEAGKDDGGSGIAQMVLMAKTNTPILKGQEIFLLEKLNFLKEKRDNSIAKKLMKDYNKFPEKISIEGAKEISNEELVKEHGVLGKLVKE